MNASIMQFVMYVDEQGYYIGDAERIANFLDLTLAQVTRGAAWHTASPSNQMVLIRSRSVRGFYKALRVLAETTRQCGRQAPIDQTVHLMMPCGHGARYIAFDDIPCRSTPCPCGSPQHWLISYSDEWDND